VSSVSSVSSIAVYIYIYIYIYSQRDGGDIKHQNTYDWDVCKGLDDASGPGDQASSPRCLYIYIYIYMYINAMEDIYI